MSPEYELDNLWECTGGVRHGIEIDLLTTVIIDQGVKEDALFIDVGGKQGAFAKSIESTFGNNLRIYICELEKYREGAVDSRYEYLEKDAYHLSECKLFNKGKKEKADVVLCSLILAYTDKKKVLSQVKKILKPGGLLLIVAHAKNSRNFIRYNYYSNIIPQLMKFVDALKETVGKILTDIHDENLYEGLHELSILAKNLADTKEIKDTNTGRELNKFSETLQSEYDAIKESPEPLLRAPNLMALSESYDDTMKDSDAMMQFSKRIAAKGKETFNDIIELSNFVDGQGFEVFYKVPVDHSFIREKSHFLTSDYYFRQLNRYEFFLLGATNGNRN